VPIVGLAVLAASALVDTASGAENHYQTALMVKLEPLSATDRTPPPAVPIQAAMPPVAVTSAQPAAAVSSSVASFNGDYSGDVEVVQPGLSLRRYPRHIELHVTNGVGTGTSKHPLCNTPGEVKLEIDASGNAKGTIDILNTNTCSSNRETLTGRVDGSSLKLTLVRSRPAGGWSTDFVLSRKSPQQAG
jgi:hypothetical protein